MKREELYIDLEDNIDRRTYYVIMIWLKRTGLQVSSLKINFCVMIEFSLGAIESHNYLSKPAFESILV